VGWKLIRTEAFMPPRFRIGLSAFIGNGIQFILTILFCCFIGLIGLTYGHKGNMKTISIFSYAFSGIFNGYYASKYYKYMGGKNWALNIMLSCLLFPAILFATWFIINSIAVFYESTAAIPFGAAFFVIILCLIIYIPLTVLGGITGKFRQIDLLPNIDSGLPRLQKPVPQKNL